MTVSSILRIFLYEIPQWCSCIDWSYYFPIVLHRQASLSLSRWYILKLHTLLSIKGGLVWQFYYSFCQRQVADETLSFCVPINSCLRFYICITQAFEKMLSHTVTLRNKLLLQLEGTQCDLHTVSELCQLFKLWGKVPLRGSSEKWSQSNSLIWVAANETSGPAPELRSITDNCVCNCAQNLTQGQHFDHHCTNQQYDANLFGFKPVSLWWR